MSADEPKDDPRDQAAWAITEEMLDRWEAELRAENGDAWMQANAARLAAERAYLLNF